MAICPGEICKWVCLHPSGCQGPSSPGTEWTVYEAQCTTPGCGCLAVENFGLYGETINWYCATGATTPPPVTTPAPCAGTCQWVCDSPSGCEAGASASGAALGFDEPGQRGWKLTSGCTTPTCGCNPPAVFNVFGATSSSTCYTSPGGTTTSTTPPPTGCLGDCPPDDWRNTAELTQTTFTTPAPTTTTSTTTPGPCTGRCTWTASGGSWGSSPTSSTCASGCDCYYPTYCPPAGCTTTYTDCSRGAPSGHGNPPNCTGTTSTTSSTTPPPGCTGECTWKYYPVIRWVIQDSPCQDSCPCDEPVGTADYCATATTPCVVTVPPPCAGFCTYRWGEDRGWIEEANHCYTVANACSCVPPSIDGTVCNEVRLTPCAGDDTPPDPGTTRPPPGVCIGYCYYCWDAGEEDWVWKSTDCRSCPCPRPVYDGAAGGEVAVVPCQEGPTTTSTTSTTTSTTTAPPCTGPCVWRCDIYPEDPDDPCPCCCYGAGVTNWTLVSSDCVGAGCGCRQPNMCGAPGSVVEIEANCASGGTTTTTTSTTTAAGCGTCDYDCVGGVWTHTTTGCTGTGTCVPPVGGCVGAATTSTPCTNCAEGGGS